MWLFQSHTLIDTLHDDIMAATTEAWGFVGAVLSQFVVRGEKRDGENLHVAVNPNPTFELVTCPQTKYTFVDNS